ncbi:hypothetical protein WICMUC_004333 [Wickerhamomyces mucosus]|uniref:CHCH domain-containing protein n=1 Tax=Wickerhamomyces mucosus TaxID=1378264 RepID=A0A9P8TAW8_9ASCO|nr:hypothetical protein WICMUC_004333 [Wickerhamomyces mucosus]
MPRSRGSSRPTVQRSAPQQQRSAHTAAASPPAAAPQHQPNVYSQPQAAQPKQPGMFAQMASTAAGVAVGSAVGHTIGAGITSMFGGSSSAPAAPVEQQAPAQYASESLNNQQSACDVDARNFTRCLSENDGNMQICDFYLQQLKACQQASRQY